MTTAPRVHLSVMISDELSRTINAYAHRLGINRSAATVVLLQHGIVNAALPAGWTQPALPDTETEHP